MLNKNVLLNILTGVIKTGDKKFACRLYMFSSPEHESEEGEKSVKEGKRTQRFSLLSLNSLLPVNLAFKQTRSNL